jgi:predicted NUDIX family NTP pyrophosphohydrolase
MKQSAGLLLFATTPLGVGVILVHPSGGYNKNAPWSLPKGEPDEGESLEQAARREVREEVGVDVTGPVFSLGFIDYQKSKKRVFAFSAPLPPGAQPRCACWEIDKCELVHIDVARTLLHKDQVAFLDRLQTQLQTGKVT